MANANDDTGGKLSARGLISLAGPETRKFLQGLLTADIGRLDRQPAIPAALLTPQGKILVEMILIGQDDGVLLDCPAGEVASLLKRLQLYKLRAKIEIADRSQELAVFWKPQGVDAKGFADPRHPDLGVRAIGPAAEVRDDATDAYDRRRIALGIAEQGADYGPSEIFPHEANLDQLGGVDFDKGCYVGQEVVSRMQHRGTARSRFVPVAGISDLPERGTTITAGGKSIGTMGSHRGRFGLALLRLDRLTEAVAAGHYPEVEGVTLNVIRPAWAGFDLSGANGRNRPMSERCPWAGNDPLYVTYHDTEWGVPKTDDRALLEKLVLEGFQSGLSWITILRKRENFRKAFHGFDAGADRPLRRKGYRAADAGYRHRPQSPQDRVDHRQRACLSETRGDGIPGTSHLGHGRRQSFPKSVPVDEGGSRRNARQQDNLEAPEKDRLPLRRPDHRLCFHAGDRHGERSPRGLPRARPMRETRQELQGAEAVSGAPQAPRAWQRMLSGRRLDLLSPDPADIEIADIAHGLARVARWNGQTIGDSAFSVAQHCCIVLDIFEALAPDADRGARLAALLHDAPEYVIGDLISPFKAAIGLDYKAFEHRLLAAIHRRFGIEETVASKVGSLIKQADRIAAFHEATRLAGFSVDESLAFFGRSPAMPQSLTKNLEMLDAWPANRAESQYLRHFQNLSGA